MKVKRTTQLSDPNLLAWIPKGPRIMLSLAALLAMGLTAQAVNYAGNANTGFGGPIGNGTLGLTDDGTNIYGTLTVGANLNDVLVIYIQTGPGGFTTTTNFSDQNDGNRAAISGFQGGNRSVMTFTNGFSPNYAIALGPSSTSFGGLWKLTNGGNNSLPFVCSVNLSPLANTGPYSFSFGVTNLGLAINTRATIQIFGTLISSTAYRSTEAIAGNDSGPAQGWVPFIQTAYASYTFDAGAPVLYPVTFQVDMSAQIASGSFNPGSGDMAYAAGTFETVPWSVSFPLSPSVNNPNVYTGTYQDADPTNTAEFYKFVMVTSGGAITNYEVSDNRPFTLQAGGQTLPLVYFNDVAPSPTVYTNALTFQIDLTPQIELGHFNPATDAIEAQGTFESVATWAVGPVLILTNNPNGANTNLYSGTYADDGNYPGTFEQYKYVMYAGGPGGTANYENIANRDFLTPTNAMTFPIQYFDNITSAYSIPVTFQVDMTLPTLSGAFIPGSSTLSAAGTFQTNQWTPGVFLLTNNPAAANTNIYSGTYIDKDAPGTFEQYKFVIDNGYESIGNRGFVLAGSAQVLPVVYWNNASPFSPSILPDQTTVTFTLDMTNAVDRFGVPFDPNNDVVFINGDFTQPNYIVPWTDPTLSSDWPQYVLTNNPIGSGLYQISLVMPAGNNLQVTYKYGIDHNASANSNTNADNEAGFAQNHVRFIRELGQYAMPMDIFGLQRTNAAAATEPAFANYTIYAGAITNGRVPLSWLGGPGVHLQTATNILGGWTEHPETDSVGSTNWPVSGKSVFFRIHNPFQP
jgi:hypothetical protein